MNNGIITKTIIKDLVSEEWVLVKVNIKYPQCGNEKINKYICDMANALYRFAEKKLLPKALKTDLRDESSEPFSLVATYKTAMQSEKFFSFYFDVFIYQSGKRSEVRRIPLNFDTEHSVMVFPLEKTKKRNIFTHLDASLESRILNESYYSDAVKRAHKFFRKTNALMCPDGIYMTYDSGIVAPHERGAVSVFLF